MAVAQSLILVEAKLTAETMETEATVVLEKVVQVYAITSIRSTLVATIPGATQGSLRIWPRGQKRTAMFTNCSIRISHSTQT